MNPKNTWFWLIVAVGLFAFIFFFERRLRPPESGPAQVLPGLQPKEINSLQVFPKGNLPIHAKRTNGVWRLTEPLDFPAQSDRIDALLAALEGLTAIRIPPHELKQLANSEEQFGFDPPQISVMLGQKKFNLQVGRQTAPGDQVFVQVVGTEGIFVANSELLKLLPKSASDWRETALVEWNQLEFDRLIVMNAGKTLELHINPTNKLWRISGSMDTRADSGKIEASLQRLEGLRAQQFVSDEPKPDLDTFGLQAPELSLTFVAGTNTVLRLEFGKSPPQDPTLAYARRTDKNTVVTVPRMGFEPWLASQSENFRDFLDRHLVALTSPPDQIEIHGQDDFTLERQTNDAWRVAAPHDFAAEATVVKEFLSQLTNLQAAEIVRDIVPKSALPEYGLAAPARQYILRMAATNALSIRTNLLITQLDFGTNQDHVFARSSGESFVYSIDPTNLAWLPDASWQMRDRQIWNFSTNDVARIVIQQAGKTREFLRKGKESWSLTSQGIMDEVAAAQIQETVYQLGNLRAAFWVQRGDQNREAYGFAEIDHRVTLELQNGETLSVAFGKVAPSQFPYAAVVIQGETWIFEFPWTTYQFVQLYLTIPPNVP